MSRDGCVALPLGAIGSSAVYVVFLDHTHLLFLACSITIVSIMLLIDSLLATIDNF